MDDLESLFWSALFALTGKVPCPPPDKRSRIRWSTDLAREVAAARRREIVSGSFLTGTASPLKPFWDWLSGADRCKPVDYDRALAAFGS